MPSPNPKPTLLPPQLLDVIYLTPAQVMEALQISASNFDNLINTNQLRSVRVGRNRRVSKAALLAYLGRNEVDEVPAP